MTSALEKEYKEKVFAFIKTHNEEFLIKSLEKKLEEKTDWLESVLKYYRKLQH